MPPEGIEILPEKPLLSPVTQKKGRQKLFHTHNAVGSVHGSKPPNKLQVTICLLLVELCEKFTFYGIVCNMILFCTIKLGYCNYQAVIINLGFVGACMVTPVLIGWLAEFLVGRIKLVYMCALLHFIGTALLPIVAFPFEGVYIDKRYVLHTLASREQKAIFYVGLSAACLGSGGIRAIVCPLSAYNLDERGQKELLSFFNWFYWLVNLGSAIVFVSISYIQQSVAKNLGFLFPFVSVLMALITVHMARSEMICQPPKGSSFLTACGVFANALKGCCMKCRYFSGNVTNWLDHAKENDGGQYSETEVESTKLLVRLIPLFAFQVLYRTCVMQIPSGFYLQTMNSNLNLNGFFLPIAAMNVISTLPFLILAPVLDCLNTCLFNAKSSRWSPTVYIIVGYASATLSVMVAGFFEVHRKKFPLVEQTLSGKVLLVSCMPCVHLAPQYILLGVAEALVTPTCSFITFRFVPSRIRGTAMQVLTVFNGAGCMMGAFLVQAAYVGSQGGIIRVWHFSQDFLPLQSENEVMALFIIVGIYYSTVWTLALQWHYFCFGDWFPNVPSDGKLERFYFFLASLMMINTLGFWATSHRYKHLQQDYDKGFRGSLLQEQLLQPEKSLKFYDSFLDCPSPMSPMETLL